MNTLHRLARRLRCLAGKHRWSVWHTYYNYHSVHGSYDAWQERRCLVCGKTERD